ncbi:hypothetical protein [Streptomyces lunaelactis]|uniref:hypothetical protein n=1 Tax=Streptomyces lunaelactis TaxID=1535768 RepID=UPI00158482EB|nr:hypothetical protein [Streptomyces lunaelactis]NUK22671.1 hypothetical protein [Streptomyces lunaelactis]NUK61899.1 hypothetical protein [Streptomyces lunaelactis]
MFRRATHTTAVAVAVILPLLGAAPALAVQGSKCFDGTPHPAASSTPVGPRLVFFGDQSTTEVGSVVGVGITGMPAGWSVVTVNSPALAKPVRLTPLQKGSSDSAQLQESGQGYRIRSDIAPGTYTLTADRDGRTVATAQLVITPQAGAEIGRFDVTPETARPGGKVVVVMTDLRAAPDENSLTVTSSALESPLTITRDSPDDPGRKGDDGSTVYAGHGALRDDISSGRYELTVVSHHGQHTRTQQLTVAGEPVNHSRPWVIGGAIVASLVLVAGAGVLVRRSRRLGHARSA